MIKLTRLVLKCGSGIDTQQHRLEKLAFYGDISLSQVALYSTHFGMPHNVTNFIHEKIRQKMRLPKVEFIQREQNRREHKSVEHDSHRQDLQT